jgi:ribonuclease III
MSKESRTYGDGYLQHLKRLATMLGVAPQQIDVLSVALTHSTFFEGNRKGGKGEAGEDNQRLEFLGDAVLDLVVGEHLYQNYPGAREGELSKMRAYLVCEASLAAAAEKLGLPQALRMGKGAEAGGDRHRPSVQADAFEAVVGAVFIARGYAKTREFILRQFGPRMDSLSAEDYEDKKSQLQELVQAQAPHGVIYRVLAQSGPDHQPCFESGVYCGKLLLGQGKGGSKKESEAAAAADALMKRQDWLDQIS